MLPKEFLEKYQLLLASDFEKFIATFDQPAVSGFRVNPLKKGTLSGEKIVDTDFGYLGKVSGKSIEFLTGQVYSQEPAAQMLGEIAKPESGMRVLDLCAAPGGKSTHLLSYLGNSGLLVSNEISQKRSKILVENLERWGHKNLVVLNESSEKLAKVFPAYFDMVVVDAPCSGEGMFRKDPEAIQYWSQDYVLECAQRQREILKEAVSMLACGGSLVYATCTWSPEEDEDNVRWLLESYPDLELIEERKFWPHEFLGEGQYIAKLKDSRATEKAALKSGRSNLTAEQRKLWKDFEQEKLTVELKGLLQRFGDQLYLLPEGLPDLSKLKIARNGLHLGTFKKKRFEPSYALGLALAQEEVKASLDLTEEEFKAYVAGNPVQKREAKGKGWVQVCIHQNGLGFAKLVDGQIKNYYPKGLRTQI